MVARLGVAMVARRGSATSGSEEGHQMGNGGNMVVCSGGTARVGSVFTGLGL